MVPKLDMEKAFDRIQWGFLKQVLANFGFSSKVISQILGCISNSKVSVLFNGSVKGFFHPSPLLFILAIEVLSRDLSKEFLEERICPYFSPRYCKSITHLLYADDTLIFLNGRKYSIEGCLSFL